MKKATDAFRNFAKARKNGVCFDGVLPQCCPLRKVVYWVTTLLLSVSCKSYRNYEYSRNITFSLHKQLLYVCVYYASGITCNDSLNSCIFFHLDVHPIPTQLVLQFALKYYGNVPSLWFENFARISNLRFIS